MAKYTVAGNQYFDIDGQILEIKRQLRHKGGSPIDPELVSLAFQDIIEGKFGDIKKKRVDFNQPEIVPYLELISGAETLILDALDGKETLANATEVFLSGIDDKFNKWDTNKPGIATKEQAVDVHDLVKDGTFAQMFSSLGTDLDKLCLTQAQIINFCKKHFNWLRKYRYATFLLFKVDEQFFIARVSVKIDGLYVHMHRFKYEGVWSTGCFHRMVVPQLTA